MAIERRRTEIMRDFAVCASWLASNRIQPRIVWVLGGHLSSPCWVVVGMTEDVVVAGRMHELAIERHSTQHTL